MHFDSAYLRHRAAASFAEESWAINCAAAMYIPWVSTSRSPYGFQLVLTLSLVLVMRCSVSKAQTHPLDPLTVSEILAVKSILTNASLLCSPGCEIIRSVNLEEPEKSDVKSWVPGTKLPARKAVVVSRENKVIRTIIVNLDEQDVESNKVYEGSGEASVTTVDIGIISSVVYIYEPFLESLKTRGLNVSEVNILPFSPGWYDVPEEEGRRIVKVQPFYINGTVNFFLRPITGITAVVDIDEQRVIKYTDNGRGVPVPKSEGTDYRLEKQQPPLLPPLRAISLEQPDGTSFKIEGNTVQWGDYWRFHVRLDGRAGSVISVAEVFDPDNVGAWRSVLYQGFVSEMFVPYQDPSEYWFFKTYMDAGEYGLGNNVASLQPFNDCPRHAQFLDGVLASSSGTPIVIPNAICIFERYAGDIGWRHTEGFLKGTGTIIESRPKVTLVVRMVASVGNYDYVLDWELQNDGLIRATVGLTGIVMVDATELTCVSKDGGANHESLHGTLISENTKGTYHDHFLTYRLDLDVDGSQNSFVESKMKRHYIPPKSGIPRKSFWDLEKHVAQTEADARIQLSLYKPSEFAVINSNKKTRLGNPVSYRLVPGATAASLLDPTDYPQVRAAFTNNQIWVTPFKKDEMWASGQFTYQSHGDDILSVWSSRNRKIADEDIVLWYTIGFHHVPTQEDFPVMPTLTGSFEMKPANFFERNPILKSRPNNSSDFEGFCQQNVSST